MTRAKLGELIYENPLAGAEDIREFVVEGDAALTFPQGRLRMENLRDPGEGQAANFVFWLNRHFPDRLAASWDFYPIREPGLAMFWFAAAGRNGEDLFDPSLAKRSGEYKQYHHGEINALHLSYFRRKHPDERTFHTCNLRKSYGFHLVAQGADPIPGVADAVGPYRVQVLKAGPHVRFRINDLPLLAWTDDGQSTGTILEGGKIGFRQMAPLMAEYADLRVHKVEAAE